MPTEKEFAKGYKIHNGLKIGKFILDHFIINETTIIKFNHYQYHIELYFKSDNIVSEDVKQLEKDLINYISPNEKTIYTSWGNPYKCLFIDKSIPNYRDIHVSDNYIYLSYMGSSHRI